MAEKESLTVSVLIPAYNVGQYVEKCLQSVTGQTYRNLQIVVIDDGSSDNTLEIIKRFAANDPRIELYSRPNKGVGATRNELLTKINGDAFLFVDADDWLEPDMIQTMVTLNASSGVDIVMCKTIRNNEGFSDSSEYRTLDYDSTIRAFLNHKEVTGSLWNKLIRTSIIGDNRFDDGISYGEDALFLWGLIQKPVQMCISERCLYHYRVNNESISHQRFGASKFTSSIVWKQITSDVDLKFPQYSKLCHAQYAHQMTMILYDAFIGKYPFDEKIRHLQQIVRKNLNSYLISDIGNIKKKLFSFVISFFYPHKHRFNWN